MAATSMDARRGLSACMVLVSCVTAVMLACDGAGPEVIGTEPGPTTDSGASSGDSSSTDSGEVKNIDAGSDSGGTAKSNGETCTTASTTSTECASGICRTQGGGSGDGGAAVGTFCTIRCDNPGTNGDPKCAGGAPFSGRCNGQSYCQISK